MHKQRTVNLGAMLIAAATFSLSMAQPAGAGEFKKVPKPAQIVNNDIDHLFAGRCFNGQTYRIYAYEKRIDGVLQSFYDYEGPVGQGTVASSATPKTLVERICRQSAEIAGSF